MRYIVLLCLLLSCALVHASDTGQSRAETAGRSLIGQPAPRMVVKTIDGQTIDLGALYGKKAVYLKFWATWCVPCREQMPHFERTFEQAGPDMAVIAIDVGFDDSVDEVRKYRQAVGLGMPIVFDDGTLGEAFHLRVTPQHVVIGRDGRILYVGHEANDKLEAALAQARTSSSANVAIAAAPKDEPHYDVGDRVPAFQVHTLDGKSVPAFGATPGQPTALLFLSPWCESYLVKSRPALAESCRAARERAEVLARQSGVRWLGVASGLWANRDELAAYQREHHIAMPLALDDSGALFRRFRVMHVPTVIVLDGKGKVVRRTEEVNEAALPL
ncbi:TlpA family protein disulfide reductase [Dyella jiangningensis]|uniref:Histidinol-phosphatase n=1 Tax=Dyella jiangningensis TaxID=1379159 RepID=A0A328P517_9GAMM|nr:TlpA disulfide reductase family protein [Dyella jiangningensis]RAO76720.1 histidinol-phosphatase [Dyella jiangningensis]